LKIGTGEQIKMSKVILTKHQAVELLPKTERVHTFVSGGFGLIGFVKSRCYKYLFARQMTLCEIRIGIIIWTI